MYCARRYKVRLSKTKAMALGFKAREKNLALRPRPYVITVLYDVFQSLPRCFVSFLVFPQRKLHVYFLNCFVVSNYISNLYCLSTP